MIDLDAIGNSNLDMFNPKFTITKNLDWYDGPCSAILADQYGNRYLGIFIDDSREERLMRWIVSQLTDEAIRQDEIARFWLQLGSYIIEFRYEEDISNPRKTWFFPINTVPEIYLPAPTVRLSDYLKE